MVLLGLILSLSKIANEILLNKNVNLYKWMGRDRHSHQSYCRQRTDMIVFQKENCQEEEKQMAGSYYTTYQKNIIVLMYCTILIHQSTQSYREINNDRDISLVQPSNTKRSHNNDITPTLPCMSTKEHIRWGYKYTPKATVPYASGKLLQRVLPTFRSALGDTGGYQSKGRGNVSLHK